MKGWILAMLRMNKTMAWRQKRVDESMKRLAASPFGNTEMQIKYVINIKMLKTELEKLEEISDVLLKCLTAEESYILGKLGKGYTYNDIAADLCINRQSSYRKGISALKAAENILFLLGYDGERMKKDFSRVYALGIMTEADSKMA